MAKKKKEKEVLDDISLSTDDILEQYRSNMKEKEPTPKTYLERSRVSEEDISKINDAVKKFPELKVFAEILVGKDKVK